ncbi:MAG: CPBP family intramembrane metalloprotease [Planctomycetales bacterium]|nr:CPBP family intramembrane metalloprotease [Planctomycetales bacterium]
MSARVTPARMIRLCLKELRESLRDRRTIVTLVLMPLLVYPLLSLVLNRVLLTGAGAKSGTFVTIGVGQELSDSTLPVLLEIGFGQLGYRQTAPVFLEEIVDDQRRGGSQADEPPASALPRPQIILLPDSGRSALREGTVDVVISRQSPETEMDPASVGQSHGDRVDGEIENEDRLAGTPASRRRSRFNPLRPLVDEIRAQNQLAEDFDLDRLLDAVGTYEVRYRDRDAQSERALQLLERMMTAINIQAVRGVLPGYVPPLLLDATPVAMQANYAEMLATMIPLVLVLMTMAGAVYPAIDLTAGERERGTMEALIVSPTSTAVLLLAKYSAVVTVSLLTALANLAAMSVTLWASGIGKLLFGDGLLSLGVIGTVLALLVLFTMFFAALLLAVTSFAKSFKEAQAYLIPLMLLALTPGVISLMPGLKFTGLLATVPLVNIVLLARQVLVGAAEWNTALVAIICNAVYALTALVVASRLFGSDASMQGSQGSWSDLLMRPLQVKRYPSLDQMALTMSAMFPLYFIASSVLPSMSRDLSTKLWISAAVSFGLILGLPLWVAWYRRIEWVTTFRLQPGRLSQWPLWLSGVVLLGGSAWMMAHEIFIAAQMLGIGTIEIEHFEQVATFKDQLSRLPWWLVMFVFALTPALCEEGLFRGFVLSSLHRYSAAWAIGLSAVLFGLMHVLTSNVLAVERFLPSTFMGLLLAWIALRTGSIWPGVALHALHNGFLLSASRFEEQLKQWHILVEEGQHLPPLWLTVGAVAFAAGCAAIWLGTRNIASVPYPIDENDADHGNAQG